MAQLLEARFRTKGKKERRERGKENRKEGRNEGKKQRKGKISVKLGEENIIKIKLRINLKITHTHYSSNLLPPNRPYLLSSQNIPE